MKNCIIRAKSKVNSKVNSKDIVPALIVTAIFACAKNNYIKLAGLPFGLVTGLVNNSLRAEGGSSSKINLVKKVVAYSAFAMGACLFWAGLDDMAAENSMDPSKS